MFSILNIDQVIRSLSGIGEVERRKGGIMQPRSSKLVGRYLREGEVSMEHPSPPQLETLQTSDSNSS